MLPNGSPRSRRVSPLLSSHPPRDHARKRAQGTTVLTAFDNPIPLSLQYIKGGGGASYFPVSAITDRLYARNQLTLSPRQGTRDAGSPQDSTLCRRQPRT